MCLEFGAVWDKDTGQSVHKGLQIANFFDIGQYLAAKSSYMVADFLNI